MTTPKEYWDLMLRDIKCLDKAKQIKERDKYTCQECGYNSNGNGYDVHVHHVYYLPFVNGIPRVPWDYPDELLKTLCKRCHQKDYDSHIIYYPETDEDRLLDKIGEKIHKSLQLTPEENAYLKKTEVDEQNIKNDPFEAELAKLEIELLKTVALSPEKVKNISE